MLTEFLLIIVTWLVDEMMQFLPEKLNTYPILRMFIKQVCLFAIKHILHCAMKKIASVIINQFVKLVKSITYFFKKNPDVSNYETMV